MNKTEDLKYPDAVSVITPCFNDFDALRETLVSLAAELTPLDQLIIIDSSDNRLKVSSIIEEFKFSFEYLYVWTPARGVYPALNEGIRNANREWVQIVNSGDGYLTGARKEISADIKRHGKYIDLHVYAQRVGGADSVDIFMPDASSVWPHQSIVMRKKVHDDQGVYNEGLKLVSDQIFFAQVRKKINWRLHNFALTYYDLNGISSKISLSAARELFIQWRLLGNSVSKSAFKSFVRPIIRKFLEVIIGKERVSKLKSRIFRRYLRI